MKKVFAIVGFILLIAGNVSAQIPGVPVTAEPRPASLSSGMTTFIAPGPSTSPSFPWGLLPDRFSNNSYPLTNNDILRENEREIAGMIQRRSLALSLASHGFPCREEKPGTEFFYGAYDQIRAMLTDSVPMELGKAVFLVENAMLGNRLEYGDFKNEIERKSDLCRLMMQQQRLSQTDNLAKNNVLFRLFTQTLQIRQPGTERVITHYPVRYNLEDYRSERDFTSHFITTLLATNKGQCYSMPLLYLILAEELGAEAYLSYTPNHSLIKIKDNKNRWYNLELTCRYVMSDNKYINNSLIKSDAIRSGLYLSPMGKKEVIASLMIQLGNYYSLKYGYDSFVIKCLHQAEKYMKVPVEAWRLESDYENRLLRSMMNLLQIQDIGQLKTELPRAYAHYERLMDLQGKIRESGYEELSPELYQRMLEHVERLKEEERQDPPSPIREIIR